MALNFKMCAVFLATSVVALSAMALTPAQAAEQENTTNTIAQWLGLDAAPISGPLVSPDAPVNSLRDHLEAGRIDGFESVIVQDAATGKILAQTGHR
ncbi:hypothetical protein [Glutamicibacter sp. NPDC087344]|uniref:hypothetical protein n=1 Tax=Glutamicibacter sp. NPDC087344 TaxID=3363994 RepID=UPI0038133489